MVLLLNWFPMLLLIGVWFFFMRQMQVGGGKAMSFGKSRAKLLTENQHRVRLTTSRASRKPRTIFRKSSRS